MRGASAAAAAAAAEEEGTAAAVAGWRGEGRERAETPERDRHPTLMGSRGPGTALHDDVNRRRRASWTCPAPVMVQLMPSAILPERRACSWLAAIAAMPW